MAVGLLLFVNGIPHYHWCANVMKLIQNGMSWEEICNHTLKVPTPYYDLNQQLHQNWNCNILLDCINPCPLDDFPDTIVDCNRGFHISLFYCASLNYNSALSIEFNFNKSSVVKSDNILSHNYRIQPSSRSTYIMSIDLCALDLLNGDVQFGVELVYRTSSALCIKSLWLLHSDIVSSRNVSKVYVCSRIVRQHVLYRHFVWNQTPCSIRVSVKLYACE